MALRLRLVPDDTKINFFSPWAMRFWLGISLLGTIASIVLYFTVAMVPPRKSTP